LVCIQLNFIIEDNQKFPGGLFAQGIKPLQGVGTGNSMDQHKSFTDEVRGQILLSFFFVCSAIGSSNMSNWCYKPVDDLL